MIPAPRPNGLAGPIRWRWWGGSARCKRHGSPVHGLSSRRHRGRRTRAAPLHWESGRPVDRTVGMHHGDVCDASSDADVVVGWCRGRGWVSTGALPAVAAVGDGEATELDDLNSTRRRDRSIPAHRHFHDRLHPRIVGSSTVSKRPAGAGRASSSHRARPPMTVRSGHVPRDDTYRRRTRTLAPSTERLLPHWMSMGVRARLACSSGTAGEGLAVSPLDGLGELVALIVAGRHDRRKRAAP